MSKFAVFILSHGRPDNVKTYNALRKCGYTGKIYILIDDQDSTQDQYIKNYGKQVIVFNKKEAAKITDAADNSGKLNTVLFARNWNFVTAKELSITHFWQLDDDYSNFAWVTNNRGDYITKETSITRLDLILKHFCDYIDQSPVSCIAIAQGGDLIGGEKGNVVKKVREGKFLRKVMNSFLFKTDKPLKFYGRMNDDVNMFTVNGSRGHLLITVPRLRIYQAATQSAEGGLTDMYKESGTYVKSFYTVLFKPASTIISMMGNTHKRLHHQIKWKNTVPEIISEDYKK